MPIEPSSPRELRRMAALVRLTRLRIKKLVAQGKRVHIIWDVDYVLCSGRSEDAFSLLGLDVGKYFTYEERLIAERLEAGPWLGLALSCGESGMQASQDVVTARSSFLALRAIYFLLSWRIPVRWQLFVGHQSKAESYRIILKSFEKDPDTHVFCVDDGKKHVDAFQSVAKELGMGERCHGVLSPQVREWNEDELGHEVEAVMAASGKEPAFMRVYNTATGAVKRMVPIVPNPLEHLRGVFGDQHSEVWKKTVVEEMRPELEKFAREVMPGRVPTDDELFMLYEMVREPR